MFLQYIITAYHVLMLLAIQNTYSSLQHCEILLEEAVTECYGDSVDKFIELVRENQLILRQRKVCVYCDVLLFIYS